MYWQDYKARFDEVHNTINYLQWELTSNVNLIQNQLQMYVLSKHERELAAAELFIERFQALVESSRTQLSILQTEGPMQWNSNQHNLNYGIYYNHSPPSYSWNGYYSGYRTTQEIRTKTRKRKVKTATNTLKNNTAKKSKTSPQLHTPSISANKNVNPGVREQVYLEKSPEKQIKKNICKNVNNNGLNISSLSSTNISPITKRSAFNNILDENTMAIKAEINDDDYIYDDLENHL